MPLDFEQQFYSNKVKNIVGVDEAGRGCLLGPVVASAVILPKDFSSPLINDSKKLSEKQREEAFKLIEENAIAIGVGITSPEKIDEMNILEATKLAMLTAINQIKDDYELILTDAVKLDNVKCELIPIIKGDAKAQCIAAASIIAKVTRDHICYELDKKYPEYNIKSNKGYGTKDHMEALEEYGPKRGLHRFSYKPVKSSLIKKVKLFWPKIEKTSYV